MAELPLTSIRGIGEKRLERFGVLGVGTVRELLELIPRDYRDFSVATPVALLRHAQFFAVRVRISEAPKFARIKGMTVLSVRAEDETGAVLLKWYNQPYRRNQIPVGSTVVACGRADLVKGRSLVNPQLGMDPPGIVPVYPTVAGLSQRVIHDAVMCALRLPNAVPPDPIPEFLLKKHALLPLMDALYAVHAPEGLGDCKRGQRRFAFQNILYYLLAVESHKAERSRVPGVAFDCTGVFERFQTLLPFRLTDAQRRVISEIAADMKKPAPMNRLLQGDVGSGKTAVALFAMYAAVQNGYQAALLAPTEILAQQHYQELCRIFGEGACLLVGGMGKRAREAAASRLADGRATAVVGTHALLEGGVRFSRLGLVVTDEQHRFGVSQRARMQEKGVSPDVLVMSATPIPRTLALILYGDLDVSVIDALPPGRRPIKTRVIPPEKRQDMYRYIEKQAEEGIATYVVCPLIEDSDAVEVVSAEAVYRELTALLPNTRIGLLHGRMRPKEKNEAIEAFRRGDTRVLVSTTVVEVGVHVESACIMVVESAERFGLAQLHQLRGRVGRGSRQSYCFLLSEHAGDAAAARFSVLTESNDGFLIAEKDLDLRGAGDFLGTRQHGAGEAQYLTGGNTALILEARAAAAEVLETPSAACNELLEEAEARYLAAEARIAMN